MEHLKSFSSLNEALPNFGTLKVSTDLAEVEKIAKAQKYGFEKTENNGLSFSLKVNDTEYFVTLYGNGRFVVIKKSPKKEEIKGDWFTSAWGTTFEYGDKRGERISSAGTGLNAMDLPIGWGVLGLIDGEWGTAKIKSTAGSFIPMISDYSPSSQKCISPKNLEEITSGKCILTIGSRGDTVKTVQSSLNFVLSKEALDLLSGSTYDKDAISKVQEVDMKTDGAFGNVTKGAVKEFQKLKGGMKVDGVVGKNTLVNLIETKEEIAKKEKEALEAEMKEIIKLPTKEVEAIELPKKEMEVIELLPPLEVQIEIEKTLKELRKEKKDSGKKRRLLKKLERLQKREEKVKDKIEKISESSLNFLSDYDNFTL
jgi:hypothetical protein